MSELALPACPPICLEELEQNDESDPLAALSCMCVIHLHCVGNCCLHQQRTHADVVRCPKCRQEQPEAVVAELADAAEVDGDIDGEVEDAPMAEAPPPPAKAPLPPSATTPEAPPPSATAKAKAKGKAKGQSVPATADEPLPPVPPPADAPTAAAALMMSLFDDKAHVQHITRSSISGASG